MDYVAPSRERSDWGSADRACCLMRNSSTFATIKPLVLDTQLCCCCYRSLLEMEELQCYGLLMMIRRSLPGFLGLIKKNLPWYCREAAGIDWRVKKYKSDRLFYRLSPVIYREDLCWVSRVESINRVEQVEQNSRSVDHPTNQNAPKSVRWQFAVTTDSTLKKTIPR